MSDEHSIFTLGTLHMLKSPLHEVEVMYRHQVVKKSIRDVWRFRSCLQRRRTAIDTTLLCKCVMMSGGCGVVVVVALLNQGSMRGEKRPCEIIPASFCCKLGQSACEENEEEKNKKKQCL